MSSTAGYGYVVLWLLLSRSASIFLIETIANITFANITWKYNVEKLLGALCHELSVSA